MTTRTTDVITVTWSAPSSETFTGFKVTLDDSGNSRTTTTANDLTTVTFNGLTAGTRYGVLIATVNGDVESTPLIGQALTSE